MKWLCFLCLVVLTLAVVAVVAAMVAYMSPAGHWRALAAPETLFALRFTLLTSVTATALAMLLGIPAAYFMARRAFHGKAFLDTLLDLPLVMPPLVTGVGLLLFLGSSRVSEATAALGLRVIFTPLGVVMAQAFVAGFIVLRGAKAAFDAIDSDYEAAALTMGLEPWLVFWRVSLPMAARGLISTVVLAWARAMGEFGATLMVAGATRFKTETLPIAVYLNMSSGEPGLAISSGLVLMALGFASLGLLRWFTAWAAWSPNGKEGAHGHP